VIAGFLFGHLHREAFFVLAPRHFALETEEFDILDFHLRHGAGGRQRLDHGLLARPTHDKNRQSRDVPAFSLSWIGMLAVAGLLGLSGLDPLKLVNISVVFGMAVMPLTYYPIMRVAMDKAIMKRHVNSRTDTALGVFFSGPNLPGGGRGHFPHDSDELRPAVDPEHVR